MWDPRLKGELDWGGLAQRAPDPPCDGKAGKGLST